MARYLIHGTSPVDSGHGPFYAPGQIVQSRERDEHLEPVEGECIPGVTRLTDPEPKAKKITGGES